MDLQTLEAGAAPADWKCLWNRYAAVEFVYLISAYVSRALSFNFSTCVNVKWYVLYVKNTVSENR